MELILTFTFITFATGACLAIANMIADNETWYIIPLVSLGLFMIAIQVWGDSQEHKERELQKCEWIVQNSGQYLLFGDPNK